MTEAYNFLFSWQLFPEKGTYDNKERPKSGTYKLTSPSRNKLQIEMNWVSLENQAFSSAYEIIADGNENPLSDTSFAESGQVSFLSSIIMQMNLSLSTGETLELLH